jgi:hypothetical protein
MPKEWKCARCATKNVEPTLTCSACRMIRGAVVVPGTSDLRFPTAQPGSPARPAEWAAHANGRPRFLGPVSIGVVILIALLIGGTVTAWSDATPIPIPTGAPTASEPLDIVDLRIGDCFDVQEPTIDAYSGLAPRSCSEAHRYEVFWTGAMPVGAYPSAEAFEAFHDAHCPDAFAAYVGEASAESRFDTFWIVPNEEGWAAGYRSIQCSVCDPANPRLTYSLKGSSPSGNGAIPL